MARNKPRANRAVRKRIQLELKPAVVGILVDIRKTDADEVICAPKRGFALRDVRGQVSK